MLKDSHFATAVAGIAQLLKDGKYLKDWGFDGALKLVIENRGEDECGYRSEFVQLVRKAKAARP